MAIKVLDGDRPASKLKDAPVHNFRRMRVVVIGAGFAGIYLGIRIPQWLRNVDLTIYDKFEECGGTWFTNTYPGLTCDIPAHSYVYSFEPNPDWSSFYAPGPEILRYIQGVAKKYSVERFMKLRHQVEKCAWDGKHWKIEVTNLTTGEVIYDTADVVLSAHGALSQPAFPNITGFETFNGKVVHTALWDHDYDYSRKSVGIIGVGSSAIQITPYLQRLPDSKLTCLVRSKTYISEPFGALSMSKFGMTDPVFSDDDKERLMGSPEKYHAFRKSIETDSQSIHDLTQRGSGLSAKARTYIEARMRLRLAKKPEIAEMMMPQFSPGCKRLTPGPGYLEAVAESNVDFIMTPIKAIHPYGVELQDGKQIQLDTLVCATGYHAVAAPPFPIVGINGKTLEERWDPNPEAYFSVAVDGFPNFFVMLGPNGGTGSGSLLKMIEAQGEYAIKCIRKLQKEDIVSMNVKSEVVSQWTSIIDEYFEKTIFSERCASWYRKKTDRIFALWPGSTLHCIETLRSPRWEDYEYTYDNDIGKVGGNLNWLGNGWTYWELEEGDVSFYIESEYCDKPASPFPEATGKYLQVPFSH